MDRQEWQVHNNIININITWRNESCFTFGFFPLFDLTFSLASCRKTCDYIQSIHISIGRDFRIESSPPIRSSTYSHHILGLFCFFVFFYSTSKNQYNLGRWMNTYCSPYMYLTNHTQLCGWVIIIVINVISPREKSCSKVVHIYPPVQFAVRESNAVDHFRDYYRVD